MVSWRRLKALCVITGGSLGGYVLIQKIVPLLTSARTVLTLPFESQIPFVPEMVIVYTFVYILPICMIFLLGRHRSFGLVADVFGLTALIHFAFFLLLPVHYELRPHVFPGGNAFLNAISVYYQLDDTTNCFPSMHVSFSVLSYFCIRRFRPEFATIFLIGAAAVSLSTLLVKQHYILDVISAVTLAGMMDYIMAKTCLPKTQNVP